MTIRTTRRLLIELGALGLVLAGCGGDADVDSGIPGVDGGIDSGIVDSGVQPDTGPMDGGSGGGQLDYVITELDVSAPGEDENTAFDRTFNTLIPVLFAGAVTDPLVLFVRFSAVDPGVSGVIVTFCQGIAAVGGGFECDPLGTPATTTASIDAARSVTTDPVTFSFRHDTALGTFAFTFIDFALQGTLDPTAPQAAGEPPGELVGGTFGGRLAAADLCTQSFDNPTLAGALGCPSPTNLGDLMDGPADMCGQDMSFDTTACTGSTDALHNAGVASMGELYDVLGSISLRGAEVVD